jgi:hypothetical protein
MRRHDLIDHHAEGLVVEIDEPLCLAHQLGARRQVAAQLRPGAQ